MKYFALLATFAILLFAGFTLVKNNRSMQSVLGVATAAYRSSTVSWKSVAGAQGYNIYFKEQSEKTYSHAVRNLPATSTSYKINYLKKSQNYRYVVKAFDTSGKEFWTSSQLWIWKTK